MGGDGREAASRVSLPGRASGDIWGQGQSSGSMVPNRPCPREPPRSRLPTVFRVSPPFFGGLVFTTSSGSWLSMVLRGSMVTPQVLPANGKQSVPGQWRQSVPGRWSRGPGCGSQRTQTAPSPQVLGSPTYKGHVGNACPIELLPGPVCDSGRVSGVWQGKGWGPWVYDPLRNIRNMTQRAHTLDVQLSSLGTRRASGAWHRAGISKCSSRSASPSPCFSSVPRLPGSLTKGFRQARPSCPRPVLVRGHQSCPQDPGEGRGRAPDPPAQPWGAGVVLQGGGSSPPPQHHPGQEMGCVSRVRTGGLQPASH